MLSSSVVYLSLNTVENKKSATKILVYSCVIDISQMDVIFSATFITSQLGTIYEGCFTRFAGVLIRLLQVSFNMTFATYLLENAILMLSQGRAFGHFLSPTVSHFRKKKTKRQMPGGGGGDEPP